MKKKFIVDDEFLMSEWNHEANWQLELKKLSRGSNKYASWICSKCHYRWSSKISNRATLGRGCPLCANKVVVEGKNDLNTTHPELAVEWHPEKNDDLKPTHVRYGSGKKVWWLCPQGHEYKASLLHRANGTCCPKCHSGRQTSFAEQATYYYVKKLYPDAISRFTAKFLGRMELDIFIPSINYAIEYDGEAWHKKSAMKREQEKYQRCRKNGIKLFRLREKMPELGRYNADYLFTSEKLYEARNLEKVLANVLIRLDFLNLSLGRSPVDINIERDRFEIQQYRTIYKSDTLAEKFPRVAREWHPRKNKKLTPEMYLPGSDHKVWWLCPTCQNEYQSSIGHRTRGTGCPKCAVEKVTQVKRKAVNMLDPMTGETIDTFISISDAARKMGINSSNISMVCKGQRPKAGGYIWRYVKET
ncbi:MAG: hypothetical protein HWE07_00335 [Cytophagia bacterium]|nr:hypothetical protein [Cytophagia bacterium]